MTLIFAHSYASASVDQLCKRADVGKSTIPPSGGAMPIGPDELAALVAARIGKPIWVREDA